MNLDKTSLRARYDEMRDSHKIFREEIQNLLKISRETFYLRIKDGSWTDPEKALISQHLGQSIEVLFPENSTSHV